MNFNKELKNLYKRMCNVSADLEAEGLVHEFNSIEDKISIYVAKYFNFKMSSKPLICEQELCLHYLYAKPEFFDFHEYREKCLDKIYGFDDISAYMPKVLPIN